MAKIQYVVLEVTKNPFTLEMIDYDIISDPINTKKEAEEIRREFQMMNKENVTKSYVIVDKNKIVEMFHKGKFE